MALKFRKVKREVRFGNEAGQEKYYAVAKTSGVSLLPKICKLIEARSSLSSADIKSVFDNLSWAMDLELSSGNVVQLGELGNFRLSLSSEGVIEEKDLDAHKIKKANIVFSPGAMLRETRRNVIFEPDDVKVVEVECDKTHID